MLWHIRHNQNILNIRQNRFQILANFIVIISMKMFDDIKIPLSSLEKIINEKQLNILKFADKRYFYAQTKDLECVREAYFVRRNRLYTQDGRKSKFKKITATMIFYNHIEDHQGNSHYFEFSVDIFAGVLQKIKLEQYTKTSKAEIKKKLTAIEKFSDQKQAFEQTTMYCTYYVFADFFGFLHDFFKKRTIFNPDKHKMKKTDFDMFTLCVVGFIALLGVGGFIMEFVRKFFLEK